MAESPALTPSSDVHTEGKRRTWTMADQFESYHAAKAAAKARGEKFEEPGQKRFQMPIHLFMADPREGTAIARFLGCDSLELGGANPSTRFVQKRQDGAGEKLVESDNFEDREAGTGLVITKAEHLETLEKDLHKEFPGFYVTPGFINYPSEERDGLKWGRILVWNDVNEIEGTEGRSASGGKVHVHG
ncbi:hypothetical protein EWM64_g10905 [Hericium alpestre]|uniref:Uncharacterized protein n=1 Tax=Hericium alpestre TaxID=135208 RepID=A0A4Y9ZGE7_9AGAM|nr:hypothetical protein EWM64_g10905 [Hericium alpestre]